MSDGVAAVLARIAQIDGQLRTIDPSWVGLAGPAASPAWANAGTFGQVLAGAGATAGSPAAGAAATGDAGAGVSPTEALGSARGSAGATPGTAAGASGTEGGAAGSPSAAGSPGVAGGPGASGTTGNGLTSIEGYRTAVLTPSWAISPVDAQRLVAASAAAADSGTLDPDPVTAPVSTPGSGAVAAGKGLGGVAFRLPVAGARVSQAFGPTGFALEPAATINGVRYAHFHQGIDYAAPQGTPVTAAAGGTIVLAGRVADGAVDVIVRHANGVETLYGHLQPDLKVRVGQRVKAGQVLGEVGMTGNTTGPHLHFSLSRGGVPLDPAPLLARGILPGVGKGSSTSDGAGSAAGIGGPNLAAFDAVASKIPYAKEIRAAALAAGIDPLLLASLVRYESGFRPKAVSRCGAMGLCQLMPFTARALGVTDPFDPAQNLRGGATYLANNLRLYGRADLALAAYQAGKGSVDRAGGMPASPTTRHYVSGIIRCWNTWLKEGSR